MDEWIVPIVVAVILGGWLYITYRYVSWRKRLHEKGIVPFNYDGNSDPSGESLTHSQIRQLEREYDEKEKNKE